MPHGRRFTGIIDHIMPMLATCSAFLGTQTDATDFLGLTTHRDDIDLKKENENIK